MAVVQFLLAVAFLAMLNQFVRPTQALLFANHGITEIVVVGALKIAGFILLLITPFLTMHLLSEERQTGSINLLYSAPISITELILGKYLGVVFVVLFLLLLIVLMPLSLLIGTTIDLLQLASAMLGLFLLVSSFTAIGLFMSSLSSQTTVAAISTFGVLLALSIINSAKSGYRAGYDSELLRRILDYMSLLNHHDRLLDGIFNSTDIIYYLLVSATFITLSIWRLDIERAH